MTLTADRRDEIRAMLDELNAVFRGITGRDLSIVRQMREN